MWQRSIIITSIFVLLSNFSLELLAKNQNYIFSKKPYLNLSTGVGQSRVTYQGNTRSGTEIIVNASLGYWLRPLIGLDMGYWHFPSISGITDTGDDSTTVSIDNNHLVALSVKLRSPVENKISAFVEVGPALGWPKIKCSSNCPVIINGEAWDAGKHRQVTVLAQGGLNYLLTRDMNVGLGVNYAHDFGPLPSFYSAGINIEYTLR